MWILNLTVQEPPSPRQHQKESEIQRKAGMICLLGLHGSNIIKYLKEFFTMPLSTTIEQGFIGITVEIIMWMIYGLDSTHFIQDTRGAVSELYYQNLLGHIYTSYIYTHTYIWVCLCSWDSQSCTLPIVSNRERATLTALKCPNIRTIPIYVWAMMKYFMR